jgi:hypothetical protein
LDGAIQGDGGDWLLIHFQAPEPWAERTFAPLLTEAERDAGVEPLRMLRKPRQDFHIFLGPRFTPIGVYGPVRLRKHDGVTLDSLSAVVEVDDRFDLGRVRVEATGRGSGPEGIGVRLGLSAPDGREVVSCELEPERAASGWTCEETLELQAPRRWYPRGMGDQPLYTLRCEVSRDGQVVARSEREIGFRSCTWAGEFDLLINGRPVRMWGVNLPPIQPGHVWNALKARDLLDLAEAANCNMIRLWGPGQPFDNDFLLAEADRRGLLIWFEFPHEFHPHPENETFIETCLREAEFYVRRHRHHASIVLWCGGNEAYLTLDEPQAADDARRARMGRPLFDSAYRQLCTALDPGRLYHPQSPSGGTYANSPLAGDTHCYDDLCIVPGIDQPIFATEHFRYTAPRPWSLRRWLGDDAWPEGFRSALRATDSTGLIPESWRALCTGGKLGTYMFGPLGDFYDTGDCLEGLVDKLDAASMKYIRRSVERMRRGRGRHDASGIRRCRGHLWWKFCDTWPKLRNALVDACGEPSGSYYALRRAYAPLLLSFELGEDDRLWLWGVNDTSETVEGRVRIRRWDEPGQNVLQTVETSARLAPDESGPLADLSGWGSWFRNSVLSACWTGPEGRTLASVIDVMAPEICCTIREPQLRISREGDLIRLSVDRLARRITLQGPPASDSAMGWRFDDNYFDLLPGEEKTVRILRAPDAEIHVRWAGRYQPLPISQLAPDRDRPEVRP